jgi:hypothetical protein
VSHGARSTINGYYKPDNARKCPAVIAYAFGSRAAAYSKFPESNGYGFMLDSGGCWDFGPLDLSARPRKPRPSWLRTRLGSPALPCLRVSARAARLRAAH